MSNHSNTYKINTRKALFYNIDPTKKPIKPKLELCKPDLNRTVVGNLTEAYGIEYRPRFGQISELAFSLPYQIEDYQKVVDNPNIDKIKELFLIKATTHVGVEYMIIHRINDTMDESSDSMRVECFGLGYELAFKLIRDYSAISVNLTQAATDALSTSTWSVGYVNAEFDVTYREFNITGSALEFIDEIAKKFNALIVWDTIERSIHFYKPDDVGGFDGLVASYGKLMKDVDRERNTDEVCTRLRLYGKDGMSIYDVNPTGTNYLEDFSYFMYPFERDSSNNVISHSHYMSDDLCHALLDYQDVVEDAEGQFETFLASKEGYQANLATKETELFTLNTELNIIEDNIDTANGNNQDPSSYIAQRNAKLAEITSKQSEISAIQSQIASVDASIATLRSSLSMENNFTGDQITELNQFIIEKDYINANIIDPKDLLEAGKEEFDRVRTPKIVVRVGLHNFLESIEEAHNWDKLVLGNKIRVYNDKLKMHNEARMVEFNIDYERGDIEVLIANVTDVLDTRDKFLLEHNQSVSTSTTVNMEKWKWGDGYSKSNDISEMLSKTWDAAAREIQASVTNEVDIGRRGIRVHDVNDPDLMVILQKGILALSNTGGNTWRTAITAEGIVAEEIRGVLGEFVQLRANQIIVGDAGQRIGDSLIDSADTWNTAVLQGELYNGVNINEVDGIMVTRSDGKHRGIFNATQGLKFQQNVSSSWVDQLYADTEGNLMVKGNVSIGSGNNVFNANEQGLSLGHANWANAPFRVNMLGEAIMESVDIRGGKVQIGDNFSVDGNAVEISGSITLGAGSTINWGDVDAPNYSDIKGSKPPSNADNTSNVLPSVLGDSFTKIGDTFIYTGTLSAEQVNAVEINANSIQTGTMSAARISGGNLNIGNEITMMGSGTKSIVMSGTANVSFNSSTDSLYLEALNQIVVNAGGGLVINGERAATRNWVENTAVIHAKFA